MNVSHPDFINKKVDILLNILELEQIFGRAEIVNALDVFPTAALKFIGKMCQAGVLEAVEGKGKGKYRLGIYWTAFKGLLYPFWRK